MNQRDNASKLLIHQSQSSHAPNITITSFKISHIFGKIL